ncbi:Hpt domain-containing protein [Wohlfahrtiimonas chitiniclastica]|uniref:Hpt domain-containing protein n=1 Tax=Wohlfahrtiimonas chitiniclastica TaxID=400946 RepID=UPI001BCA9929|nr:Hpt domain-containing protein [Wohlfahrtiimonas chitiniclastica]MBS7817259.1 Hpt domain-containing protein [Wohlfahrtiimonas chitiniclastica]MBS7822886.1 Hpt domain-containing protein [Wohlfahrtiimonas chitiniclastica]MBS7830700.1 Hpt domain-containing protein [Wohlfahrtiimonas chitiniclastica]MBS7832668.1 Hpt domain-containing protein [Wohlfahrtiimonas chitiniclastica]
MTQTIELTDADVVDELKVAAELLRDTLETLLEDSEDEAEEKATIASALEEIAGIFTVLSWDHAAQYTTQAGKHVAALSAFGEGDAEDFVLRYCLLLEQSIDIFTDLGRMQESDVVEGFDAGAEVNEELNLTLIKMLRTLYQKQLLQLIRTNSMEGPLNALNALSRDISASLPEVNGRDWSLLSFYLQALLNHERPLSVETHRLLAQLDGRLAQLLDHQAITPDVSEALLSTVRTLTEGENFIEKSILVQNVYSISPAVYKRFGQALKDDLIKIHEQLERVYLDQAQRIRLEEFMPFLHKLIKVLDFMGLKRLSVLTTDLVNAMERLIAEPMESNEFNELVSQYWVLESYLADLWGTREQPVPLSYNETQNWAYINAKHRALKLFVAQYGQLRDAIAKSKDAAKLAELQKVLYDLVKAEGMLSIVHSLTRYFNDDFMLRQLSQEALGEVTLAVEYISNMHLENREVSAQVIEGAKGHLQRHQALTRALNQYSDVDVEMIMACKEDFDALVSEFSEAIDVMPMDARNYETLIRIAHTLRGNAALMKLTEAEHAAAALERAMTRSSASDATAICEYRLQFLHIIELFNQFLQPYQ